MARRAAAAAAAATAATRAPLAERVVTADVSGAANAALFASHGGTMAPKQALETLASELARVSEESDSRLTWVRRYTTWHSIPFHSSALLSRLAAG